MIYYSTRNKELTENLTSVILSGLAPDGGLFLPSDFKKLDETFWQNVGKYDYNEILYTVLTTLTIDDIYDRKVLKAQINTAFDFEPKLIKLSDNQYILDLNQGPTSAFKDFGANTLAAFLNTITEGGISKTVLVATSGDTGSAVANALKDYSNAPNLNVIILYPKGRVSADQRKLMTTVGGNIYCLEVDGSFDDCQKLVKQAMSDDELKSKLTSANSINLIRLYGQIAYYIFATSRIGLDKRFVFSVPSGNLGNVTAGYISKLIGNPIKKFIVAHNANDMFNGFILNGIIHDEYTNSKQTISSAMDVAKPSNLERLITLFGGKFDFNGKCIVLPDITAMQREFYVQGFSDDETKSMMKKINQQYNFQADPHTAVAFLGLENCIVTEHPEYKDYVQVILSTAHASKFAETFKEVNSIEATISQPILDARQKEERFTEISADYNNIKTFIQSIIAL
jgi:threonine synthase